MNETALIDKQKEALKKEKEIIKMLKQYKKLIEKISSQIDGDKVIIGKIELFKTETPSLIVESKQNQRQIDTLINEIDTVNSHIADFVRRF